jgi:hypothetical protein
MYRCASPCQHSRASGVSSTGFSDGKAIGESAELIRYREGASVAMLDLRKVENSVLMMTSVLADPGPAEALGETAFLAVDASAATSRDSSRRAIHSRTLGTRQNLMKRIGYLLSLPL